MPVEQLWFAEWVTWTSDLDTDEVPLRVVQRRPVVCDQGQRCVV